MLYIQVRSETHELIKSPILAMLPLPTCALPRCPLRDIQHKDPLLDAQGLGLRALEVCDTNQGSHDLTTDQHNDARVREGT